MAAFDAFLQYRDPPGTGAKGRFGAFAKPLRSGCFLREADGWSRREPDIADAGRNITIGREAGLKRSARERPEFAP
jgi:hypothetical protein